MKACFAAILVMMILTSGAQAQVQSNGPADRAAAQNVSQALVKAGLNIILPRSKIKNDRAASHPQH